MDSKHITLLLTLLISIFIISMVYTGYDYFYPKETITTTIIDKWFESSENSYKVELEDHRIFSIGSFDYFHLTLNEPYTLKVYKKSVLIVEERWRI